MCDDLLKNMDNRELNCVVFLDVRKAFDSINHEILLDKMHNFFGITGTQLKWFESYLNNRVQQCLINGNFCVRKRLHVEFPRGLSWVLYYFYYI